MITDIDMVTGVMCVDHLVVVVVVAGRGVVVVMVEKGGNRLENVSG